MTHVAICVLCKSRYEPEETVYGPRLLKEFDDYTVDVRLEQFRKVKPNHGTVEFIDFDSPKGQRLLQKMHDELLQHLQEALDEEE